MSHPVKRVKFDYPRADLRHLKSGVVKLKDDHIVWWYNSIRANTRGERTIPEVEVMFKKLKDDVPSSGITWASVPLTALPHYRIGSIWRDGQCISDTEMEVKKFDIDFSPEKWVITSRAELLEQGQGNIFHEDDYPLKFSRDLSTLLNFSLPGGKNLIVPCIEYFVRAYARNMAVCKALSTLTLREVKSVFFKCQQRDAFRWLIKPTDAMRNADAIFLAHFLYDNYTENQVKRLNTSFVSKGPNIKVFPDVAPWFLGDGKLLCRGHWINQGNTFLCLGLLGSTQPQGQEIELFRETFDSNGGEEGGRVVLPQVVRTARAEEFLTEESAVVPDAQGERVIVKPPPFETLGPKRAVKKIKSVRESNRGVRGPQPPETDSYSSGDGAGDGKGVGKSEHVSDMVLESQGFLLDIWNAFLSIKRDNPERVSEVSWYTPQHYGTSSPPRIILFNRSGLNWNDHAQRQWIYLEPGRAQLRGFMILKVVVDDQSFFCFEIERQEPSEKHPNPRGFSGVLMKAHTSDPVEFQQFVEEVCTRIRNNLGIFKNIMRSFPKETIVFAHRAQDQDVRYRRRLINVFAQAGVVLE
ncbi:hypothetical protein C4K06_6172 [Pseudomonas chlororaphis subsp. aureofaciens]|uniref:hypothetical protein n=1 Tax=Pseudomonas chlororaphis TaxID=587753 RepID=UPI000F6F4D54|nr:hypothetical protein [Pseudomonas chlororaphis]AZE39160.1 hypothetical protein C4K06_6172 [Pseudomonas chlororaphis subsp. aureofaciens]